MFAVCLQCHYPTAFVMRGVSKDNIYIIIVYCVDIKQHMSGPQL